LVVVIVGAGEDQGLLQKTQSKHKSKLGEDVCTDLKWFAHNLDSGGLICDASMCKRDYS
jgi:hypothetical protein